VRAATLADRADDQAATVVHGDDLSAAPAPRRRESVQEVAAVPIDPRLNAPLPTGERRPAPAGIGLSYGVSFHSLMEILTGGAPPERATLRRALGLTERAFAPMWDQAQHVLAAPALARFFDAAQYRRALNEVPYTTETGDVRRIDRLVEFENEVWVLDYKTGENPDDAALAGKYRTQLGEYCAALRAVYPGKTVRGLLVFSGGEVMEQ
jgi:ATP-dependent helicase/nuclease subunit A